MEPSTPVLRRAVLAELLALMESGKGLLPAPNPLPFDPVPGIETAAWSISIVDDLVKGELRELTNQINQWLGSLRHWHAWNAVLVKLDEDARWLIEWEWVEPTAFHCMSQPSATRNRFVMVATNALHQVRMAIDPKIDDVLLGDPTPTERGFYPSRSDKERELKELARPWAAGKTFVQRLGQLDDRAYRRATANFRSRANHGIAPRFSVGDVAMVTRTREQAMRLQEQPDKTYMDLPVPGKLDTSYSFGGTPPLSMQGAWGANRAQFEHARRIFDAYVALLDDATAAMPRRLERGRAAVRVGDEAA